MPDSDHRNSRPPSPAAVDAIRAHQRNWLEQARNSAQAGDPFAICHGDEYEEVFSTLGIPVLVANYWNFLIVAKKQAGHYSQVLEAHGYPAPHFLALGLAASMEPEQAPWGGLPRPLVLLGSTRDEEYLRTSELWARQLGCPCYPLDFGFSSRYIKPLPENWWRNIRTDWESMVDQARLELRVEQGRELLDYLQDQTGRHITDEDLAVTLERVNQQMDLWQEANDLIAEADTCPVTLRDQLAAYQAMWHRGTADGIELIRAYRNEIRELVAKKHAAYSQEKIRLFYWSTRELPPFHQFLESHYGAVFVGSAYHAIVPLYARQVGNDPMRALAARQLLLFAMSGEWLLDESRRHRADAVVLIEPDAAYPSETQLVARAAGLPSIALPDTADNESNRARLADFMENLQAFPTPG